MLDMIAAGVSSLNAAKDIAKGISALKEEVAVQMKAAELLGLIADVQGSLNDAQAKIYELQVQLREANEKLAKRADFDRYELCNPYESTIIYRLRKDQKKSDEPMHYICPKCKEDGYISPIGASEYYGFCMRCRDSYQLGPKPPSPIRSYDPYE